MKIVATADTHGNLPVIPECDVLVLGGDICPDFLRATDRGSERQRAWLDTTFREWLAQVPAERTLAIGGNHDFGLVKRHLVGALNLPWTYLQDDTVEIDEMTFHGTPWVPNLPFWAFFASDAGLYARASQIPECDILVSHGPPWGYGDLIPGDSMYGSGYERRVGDSHLDLELHRIKPEYVFCGHIHEGFGNYAHPSGATIANVAYVNESYVPTHDPAVFNL